MRKMKDSGIEWIGDIPEGWEVNRLKSHIYVKDKKEKYLNQKYIGLENVESWTGKYRESALTPEGLCNVFEKNDILFGKLRPYLAKCIVADFDGLCSTEFIVICSYGGCNKYFKYVLLSQPVIEEITSETYGTKMPRANWEKIGNITLVIPPLSEQQRIADYLDAKCARIDETAELVRQSMEKLRAYKLSLITETVTKGLDPDVPMKDSGIPWIGKIPISWNSLPLKRVVASVKTGSTPKGAEEKYYAENGLKWFTPADFTAFPYIDSSVKRLSESGINEVKIFPQDSVLLIGIGATMGKVALACSQCSANQQINSIQCKKELLPLFLTFYLSTITDYLFKCGKFTTLPILNQEETKNIYIPLPPLAEQQRIADYLDAKCARIDTLLEEKERLLERLAEYRKSLIFECVTGKREVSA